MAETSSEARTAAEASPCPSSLSEAAVRGVKPSVLQRGEDAWLLPPATNIPSLLPFHTCSAEALEMPYSPLPSASPHRDTQLLLTRAC